jgi:hypothetical protein
MHQNTAAALKAGRERWLQRMRLAKQEGLIERFPNGRRTRGAPKLHPNRTIRRAQKIIEGRMAKDTSLRVVPNDPRVEVPLTPEEQEQDTAASSPEAAGNDASPTPAERFGEAQDLLEDLVSMLLDAPGLSEGSSSLWNDVALAMPDELYDRLDAWVDKNMIGTE